MTKASPHNDYTLGINKKNGHPRVFLMPEG